MTGRHVITDLTLSTVRIFDPADEPIGAGILVGQRHILTCAHVVNTALGRDKNCREPPEADATIRFDFPIAAAGEILTAGVIKWQLTDNADIAGLELLDPLPSDLPPVPLKQVDDLIGQETQAFGFPAGYPRGMWVPARVSFRVGGNWLQLSTTDPQQARFISGGFSGGPIWTPDQSGIVGITVESDKEQVANCIPTDVLTDLWPKLQVWSKPANPYRGLFAFREQDANFFFGRDAFADQLVEAVNKNRLVAVLGPSGSGKSSVVFAGLVPRLRRTGNWQIAHFRPANDPFESLAGALLPLYETGLDETDLMTQTRKAAKYLQEGDLSLETIIAKIHTQHADVQPPTSNSQPHFLLIADQFEELYTLSPEADTRRRFLDLVLKALGANYSQLTIHNWQFTFLLSLRADFLGRATSYRPFADALQGGSKQILGPMTREELAVAIAQPARVQNVPFQAGLEQRILQDVGSEPGNLPLLEFALTLLWEKQQGNNLTHATYEAIGQVGGALAQHAERVYAGLSDAERTQARHIFTQLVKPGEGTEDTRRLATRTELETNWPLVTRLANQRLVVTSQAEDAQDTVEVAHEALIRHWDRLRAWMSEGREFRVWQDRLRFALAQWQEMGKDESTLLQGALLIEAREKAATHGEFLSPDERAFIERSVALWEKKRRRIVIAAGVIVVLIIVSWVIANVLWISKYSSVAPDFTPALPGIAESSAELDSYVGTYPNMPALMSWYEYEPGGLQSSSPPSIDYSRVDHYLYYGSKLNTSAAWTGFLFWWKFPLPPLDASEKTELIIIIYAEKSDTLEVGFKDADDNESKAALKVEQGWAGYRIALTEFESIDFSKLQLFLIAHTRGVGSIDANTFRVALLDLN